MTPCRMTILLQGQLDKREKERGQRKGKAGCAAAYSRAPPPPLPEGRRARRLLLAHHHRRHHHHHRARQRTAARVNRPDAALLSLPPIPLCLALESCRSRRGANDRKNREGAGRRDTSLGFAPLIGRCVRFYCITALPWSESVERSRRLLPAHMTQHLAKAHPGPWCCREAEEY